MRSTLILVPAALAALSATHVLQRLIKPADRRTRGSETEWLRFVAAIADPELHAVVAYCLIGLLLTSHFNSLFPGFRRDHRTIQSILTRNCRRGATHTHDGSALLVCCGSHAPQHGKH